MRPGRPLHHETVHLDVPEGLPPDDRLDVQVEAAAVGQPPLDRVEPPLPSPDLRVVAEAVLQEDVQAPGFQDPVDLGQRPIDARGGDRPW
jgi:hypothetical protein